MAAGIGVRHLLASALAVAMLTAALPLMAMPSALAATAVPTFSVSVSGTAGNFFYTSPTEDIIPIWEQTSYGLHEHIRVVAATRDGKSQYTFDFGTPIGKGHPSSTASTGGPGNTTGTGCRADPPFPCTATSQDASTRPAASRSATSTAPAATSPGCGWCSNGSATPSLGPSGSSTVS
jgi:hypothetical protein